jgi:hypothetical protein
MRKILGIVVLGLLLSGNVSGNGRLGDRFTCTSTDQSISWDGRILKMLNGTPYLKLNGLIILPVEISTTSYSGTGTNAGNDVYVNINRVSGAINMIISNFPIDGSCN